MDAAQEFLQPDVVLFQRPAVLHRMGQPFVARPAARQEILDVLRRAADLLDIDGRPTDGG